MPHAAVAFEFDPFLRLGDAAIGLETVGLALAIVAACAIGALVARRTAISPGGRDDETLRAEDLVFVVLAAIPGGVVGGRLGHVLLHLDYYAVRPAAIVDPGQGSLELALGVAGAALTGGLAARLLNGAAGPWFHAAAFPTLVVIGAGKVALALRGAGQGLPIDAPWATSYVGAGPWGSLAPEVPSHPSQLLEAGGTALVALLMVGLSAAGLFRVPDGRAWLVAVAGWAAVRVVVAGTWRDAPVLGPLRAEQLIAIGLLAGCAALAVALPGTGRRAATGPRGSIVTLDREITSRDTADPALHGSEERT